MRISKHFTFEASHILPKHPGKCSRLHGHSWGLIVVVEGPVNPSTGFVVDYAVLSGLVTQHVIDTLDHQHLGYGVASTPNHQLIVPPFGETFYPSSENLARAIFMLLSPLVKELGTNVELAEIRIAETCTSETVCRRVDAYAGF